MMIAARSDMNNDKVHDDNNNIDVDNNKIVEAPEDNNNIVENNNKIDEDHNKINEAPDEISRHNDEKIEVRILGSQTIHGR